MISQTHFGQIAPYVTPRGTEGITEKNLCMSSNRKMIRSLLIFLKAFKYRKITFSIHFKFHYYFAYLLASQPAIGDYLSYYKDYLAYNNATLVVSERTVLNSKSKLKLNSRYDNSPRTFQQVQCYYLLTIISIFSLVQAQEYWHRLNFVGLAKVESHLGQE